MPIIPYSERKDKKSLWLYEFARDFEKKSKGTDYLKDYINRQFNDKKFNTIEEKLADIKERIGFNLTTEIIGELEKTSSNDCGCKSEKSSCSCKITSASSRESEVAIMKNILDYIKDMIRHQPEVSAYVVISRCKEEEGLGYSAIEHKINKDKLIKYIEKLTKSPKQEKINYISLDDNRTERADLIADYYSHSMPTR